jgi:hypothetical protein
MEQRNRFINTRFTENEFQNIGAAAKKLGYSRSEYLRLLLLSNSQIITISKEPIVDNGSKLPKYNNEKEIKLLLNIANNINQIAKFANQVNSMPNGTILANMQHQIGTYLDSKMQ